MEELAKMLQSRLGLSEEQALKAAAISIGFLREKLPKNLAGTLDKLSSTRGPGMGKFIEGALGGLADDIGGMQGTAGKGEDTE